MVKLNEVYTADPNMVDEFAKIPDGVYRAMLADSKMNNKNTGITCEFVITDGEFSGRKLFQNLSVFSDNSIAVKIGQKFLNQMALAANLSVVTDTAELHGKVFSLKVGTRKDDANANEIKSIDSDNVSVASTTKTTPPWKR